MEDRILLCLGPQTFTADISSQGGKCAQGEEQDEKLHADQQRHDPDCEVQFTGDGDIPEPPIQGEPMVHERTTIAMPVVGAAANAAPMPPNRLGNFISLKSARRFSDPTN